MGLNRKIITRGDLYQQGCTDDLIDRLESFETDKVVKWPPLNELPALRKKATDVYFLGMRGSGKSTMLASFFSYTDTIGVLRNVPDNSFGNKYKNQLTLGMAAGNLPESTPSEFINFVPVDLKYEDKKIVQPANFLDMAGERIKAVAEGGITEFQGYKDYLDSENGKILIFVINYFAENRVKILDQNQHLQETLALLKKFNILRRTDAIYLILTKADLFPETNKQKFCDEYLSKHYRNFLQACKEAKVDFKFVLKTFPFSLGPSKFGYILEDCDPNTNTNLITYPKLLLQQFEEDMAGGGGGGGGGGANSYAGGGGGGVGLLGEGLSGTATATNDNQNGGTGGSGGTAGGTPSPLVTLGIAPGTGGLYGGGAGGTHDDINNLYRGSNGGTGAVRIIWGGGRSYPLNAANSTTFLTTNVSYGSFVNVTTPILYDSRNSGSLVFNNLDNYVAMPELPSQTNSPLSVFAWVFLNATPVGTNGIWGHYGVNNNVHYEINPTATRLRLGDTNKADLPMLAIGSWQFVGFTSTGSSHSYYVNGVLTTTWTGPTGTILGSGSAFPSGHMIGRSDAGRVWNGRIAHVAVYTTELTAAEVLNNFNALRGRYGV